MAAVYEDNFGFWNIDGPEERAFFEHIKRQSVYANCERCQRLVGLIPPKTFCASCVCAVECGAPLFMSEYDRDPPAILDPRGPTQRALRPRVWQLRARRGHRCDERMAAKGSSPS
jgi:hypothetical protein